jgi:NTE family protein
MKYPFRNLIFEGGGVKGIAYAGALEVLKEQEILSGITRIGGTSAGAMTGLLVGLNYDIDEIVKIISSLDFRNFLDDTWGVIRDSERLITQFGWYKGDYCRNWLSKIIAAKTGDPNATFADLQAQKAAKGFKDLYFIGTNLSTGYSEAFSFEHTPGLSVADAVRISMSMPFMFVAPKSPRGDCYTDGGVLDNYPVRLFDRQKYIDQFSATPIDYQQHNQALKASGIDISPYVFNLETLGFRLASKAEIGVFRDQAEPPHHAVNDLFAFTWRVIETLLESQNDRHLHSNDWERTIYIDALGVKTTDFGLTDEMKAALLASGRSYARQYFNWYDSSHNNQT